MKTILLTSQKGGGGKSTVAQLLSVEAERTGDGPAWLIDTDPQATVTAWHERREAETPQRAEVPFHRIADALRTMEGRGAAYCFIDSAPTISPEAESLIALADLILLPVKPSPADLWACGRTVDLIKQARKPFLFVINQAKLQSTITAQTIAALSKHGPIAETFIGDRVDYAKAMTGGMTAPELSPKGPAAQEIRSLWQNVKSCFQQNIKPSRSVKYA